jgi:hypothetical protein
LESLSPERRKEVESKMPKKSFVNFKNIQARFDVANIVSAIHNGDSDKYLLFYTPEDATTPGTRGYEELTTGLPGITDDERLQISTALKARDAVNQKMGDQEQRMMDEYRAAKPPMDDQQERIMEDAKQELADEKKSPVSPMVPTVPVPSATQPPVSTPIAHSYINFVRIAAEPETDPVKADKIFELMHKEHLAYEQARKRVNSSKEK